MYICVLPVYHHGVIIKTAHFHYLGPGTFCDANYVLTAVWLLSDCNSIFCHHSLINFPVGEGTSIDHILFCCHYAFWEHIVIVGWIY
jgi:hypothetical protein